MVELDRIICGDCREEMKQFPDNHFHAVVTDPPYELGFMGKSWDASGIAYNVDLWREVLRVLRPGGYMLAFGGSRTYHRMACAIEDAGFFVHPMIAWVQGQGFPKATNLSKMLDKDNGINNGSDYIPDKENEIFGKGKSKAAGGDRTPGAILCHAPASPEAIQWDGWYYGRQSLKPAIEPIMMAQKPPEGRMVDNVRKWGCGAVNVDASRIGLNGGCRHLDGTGGYDAGTVNALGGHLNSCRSEPVENLGRWPANFILGAGEPVKLLDEQSGALKSGYMKAGVKYPGNNVFGKASGSTKQETYGDQGTASRFFLQVEPDPFYYCGKADPGERGGSIHPTMKPLDLMRYLCRLVTPPEGIILDPFAGSGTTCLAARLECFHYIGIEQSAEYCEIARKRIAAVPRRLDSFFQQPEEGARP